MKNPVPMMSALTLGLALGLSHRALAAPADTAAPLKLAGVWKLNKELSDNPSVKMMDAMRDRGGPGGGGRGMGGPGGGMGGPGGGGGMGPGGGGGMGGGGAMGGGGGMGGGMGGPGGRSGRGPGGPGGMFANEPPLDGTPEAGRTEGYGRRGNGAPPADGDGAGQRSPQGPPPENETRQGQGGPGGPGGRRGPGGMGPIPSPQFTIEQDGDNFAMRTDNGLRLLHTDGQKRKKEGDAGRFEVTARFLKGSLLIESKPEMGGKRKETYTMRPDGRLQIDFELEGAGPMPDLKFKLVYEATAPSQF